MALRVRRVERRPPGELGNGGGRLAAFGLLLVVWIVGLGARLVDLQVVQGEHFAELARGQQQTVVSLDAPRGAILDARGRELAVSIQVRSIYANPQEIAESGRVPSEVAQALRKPLGLSRAETRQLEERLAGNSTFVFVARKVDHEVAEEVAALELGGIRFLEESRREYPMGQLAAHVLGYVGTDNSGLAGLEYRYDDEVTGRSAQRPLLRDASGTRFVAPWSLEETPQPGADLILTLDSTLQHLAERALADAVERHRARAGIFVLLDARDAAVLAMANYPTFDPNRFGSVDEKLRANRAVADAYEPGSTFKMVTAAAALDSLSVRPDDRFDCEDGATHVAGIRIRDHKPFGVLTFREVIANSSNVGTIKAALRVGNDSLQAAVREFGFGADTGIDLGYENSGLLVAPTDWNTLTSAYVSFGHSLSVSPIQMANAYVALASGRLQRPYVVRAVRRDGELHDVRPQESQPLSITAATRKDLIRLLEGVVEEGTGELAAIEGYRVAGKTGTAQKSNASGYSLTGRLASFVGFVPAGQPRLVGLVMIDEPKDITGGGTVAAPVFSEVIEPALLYLGIKPDRDLWERRGDFLALQRRTPARDEEAEAPAAGAEPAPVTLASLRGSW